MRILKPILNQRIARKGQVSIMKKAILHRSAAVIIALLLTYIVWLLFLRPVVYGVFGWNSWENVQEQAATQQTFVETTTQLNLRSAPSTESGEIVVAVPAGTRLEQISFRQSAAFPGLSGYRHIYQWRISSGSEHLPGCERDDGSGSDGERRRRDHHARAGRRRPRREVIL